MILLPSMSCPACFCNPSYSYSWKYKDIQPLLFSCVLSYGGRCAHCRVNFNGDGDLQVQRTVNQSWVKKQGGFEGETEKCHSCISVCALVAALGQAVLSLCAQLLTALTRSFTDLSKAFSKHHIFLSCSGCLCYMTHTSNPARNGVIKWQS